jgi:putative Mg2+ transporter-C (MgtC) family protein
METLSQILGAQNPTLQQVLHTIIRLALAAFLGGIIGLERELKHKPAGLRTHLFICFGAAFFTVISTQLASAWGGDHTRIAAQIIPGIGFIGAGSILHSRGSVTGLTTAATLFVVASIGMAAGGGLYLPAIFATLLVFLALVLLGWMEGRFSLKAQVLMYELTGGSLEETVDAANAAVVEEQQQMQMVRLARFEGGARVQFTVEASRNEHEALLRRLRQIPTLQSVQMLGASESE